MPHAQRPTQLMAAKHHIRGFALPTILIASIVMLLVLLASVTSTTAVRTAMKDQYYSQLAQVAGEAGVAYAQACLNANGRVPLWSDATPLKSNTDCSGTELVACLTTSVDPLCSVTRNGNIRSNFSVGHPPTDVDGKATTIPNTGYVEVLRTSNSAVWRRYNQKSSPTAVVPDLCSGTATSTQGWNNATIYSLAPVAAFPEPLANSISLSTGNLSPGPMYLRKDFAVTKPGVYTLQVRGDDHAIVSVDGAPLATSDASLASATVNLASGCHILSVKLVNDGIAPNPSLVTASLKLTGESIPLVVTDRTWRISAGNTVHYSMPNYYEDTSAWVPDRVIGLWSNTALPWGGGPATWPATSGDSNAYYISTVNGQSGGNYPGDQYSWFRNTPGFTLATTTQVKVSNFCDDICTTYLDGQVISTSAGTSGPTTTTLTIGPGKHNFGVMLYNLPSANVSGFLFAAVNTADGSVLARSDSSWDTSNFWSASPAEYYSFDTTYRPNPSSVPSGTVSVLAVGGGGGGGMDMGGGGGGGGVVYNPAYTVTSSVPVTIGGGGNGAPAAGTNGQPSVHQYTIPATSGGSSLFGTIRALGGGFGGSSRSDYTPGINGGSGGSGGGSSGYNIGAGIFYGGAGGSGQGNKGGNSGTAYYSGGGGGAGGVGVDGPSAPNGGAGIQYSTMSSYYWGGGGGGASYSLATGGNGGIGGGGGGAVGVTTGGAGLNAGSAGGGGIPNAQTNMPGGNAGTNTGGGGGGGSHYNANNKGGNGGSGIVIISYLTGTMTATGGTITTLGLNTIHTFTSSGTFTILTSS